MSIIHRIYCVLMVIVIALPAGCQLQPTPEPTNPVATKQQLDLAIAKIETLTSEVQAIKERLPPRWDRYVKDSKGEHSVVAAKVDLRAALKNAFELIMNLGHSKEEVIGFVKERFGAIWERRVGKLLPVGGDIAKRHFQDDIADDMNKLLTE